MPDENKEKAVKLLGALLRMPPKPHSEMRLGKNELKRKLEKAEIKPTKAAKKR